MAERLPPGAWDNESMRLANLPNGISYTDANGERHSRSNSVSSSYLENSLGTSETNMYQHSRGHSIFNGSDDYQDVRLSNGGRGTLASGSFSESVDGKESGRSRDADNGARPRNVALSSDGDHVEAEWIEQYEPGVYITLVALKDGTRDLKRVRFRYFHLVTL